MFLRKEQWTIVKRNKGERGKMEAALIKVEKRHFPYLKRGTHLVTKKETLIIKEKVTCQKKRGT